MNPNLNSKIECCGSRCSDRNTAALYTLVVEAIKRGPDGIAVNYHRGPTKLAEALCSLGFVVLVNGNVVTGSVSFPSTFEDLPFKIEVVNNDHD